MNELTERDIVLIINNQEILGKNLLDVLRDRNYSKELLEKNTGIKLEEINSFIEGEWNGYDTIKIFKAISEELNFDGCDLLFYHFDFDLFNNKI